MSKVRDVLYKIRDLRERKNLTQEHLSRELGISIKSYSNLENDESKLSVERLFKISEVLETPIEYFFSTSQNFEFNNCESSGYLNNPVFQNTGYKDAILAKDETIKVQNELIQLLKQKSI